MSHQFEMVCLDELVPANHNYRKFTKIFDFDKLKPILRRCETANQNKGYGVMRLFKCTLLQHTEDLSLIATKLTN